MPPVRLGGVSKSFGDMHALCGIDPQIEPGEMVALLGSNGAGKTATIDMLLAPYETDVQRLDDLTAAAFASVVFGSAG